MQQFCYSAQISDLIVSGSNIQWYLTPSGGAALSSTYSLTNGSTYYASQTQNGCESIGRFLVTVSIINPPPPSGNTTQIFCNSAQISDLIVSGSNVQWYLTPSGGLPLSQNYSLTNGSTYYASQTLSGCQSINRLLVNVNLIIPIVPSGLPLQYFCKENNSSLADINLSYNYSLVFWDSAVAGTILPLTHVLSDDETVYASSIDEVNNCESIARFPIRISIINSVLSSNNLITINNNNLNDKLIIDRLEKFTENIFNIYDRYGNLVWSTKNYHNDTNFFSGKSNQSLVYKKDSFLPTGTYYFILEFESPCLVKNYKGFIQIDNNLD